MDRDYESRWGVRMLRNINSLYARRFHELRVEGECPIPEIGPGIVVCNHISGLDPSVVQACTPRIICWMMAQDEIDRLATARPLLNYLQVIPVTRSGQDTAGVRKAMRALKDGRILGIFPEGRIEKSRRLLPLNPGAVMLAKRSGAPIFPAVVEGTVRNQTHANAYLLPQQMTVRWGAPKNFSAATECLDQHLQALQTAMSELLGTQPRPQLTAASV